MNSIEVRSLSKRFGAVAAVDEVSFDVRAGAVTGFLGPNGAGKTTTLRMVLGLARPSGGSATVEGRPYRELDDPARSVGAVLERAGFHPGRSGRDHLRVVARAAGLPERRVAETLTQVGLEESAGRRVGGYSLGMRQRLALATALLGEPRVLVLDEPSNGLDPQGIRWLRDFLRWYASTGKAVLVSSHVLAEVAQTADEAIVISRGKVVAQGSIAALTSGAGGLLEVRTPGAESLSRALLARGWVVERPGDDVLHVRGASAAEVGDLALAEGVAVHGLAERGASLEDVFLELTGEAQPRGPDSAEAAPLEAPA